MKIVLFTQDDTIFLNQYIPNFLQKLSEKHEIVGVIILEASPFGKRLNLKSKICNTISIFGTWFFVTFAFELLYKKFVFGSISKNLKALKIPEIKVCGNVNSKENILKLNELNADLFISLSANQIFREKLLNIPKHGTLNLHCSLLPKNRGLMPSFWALAKGDTRTGASVFLMDEGIDSGPIVLQKTLCIEKKNLSWLIHSTKKLGIELMLEAVEKFDAGKVELQENSAKKASYNTFPTKKDVRKFIKNGARFR